MCFRMVLEKLFFLNTASVETLRQTEKKKKRKIFVLKF